MDSLSRFFAFALLMLVVAFGIACGASEEDSETFMLMAGGEGVSILGREFRFLMTPLTLSLAPSPQPLRRPTKPQTLLRMLVTAAPTQTN